METALVSARLPETAHRHSCYIKINLYWNHLAVISVSQRALFIYSLNQLCVPILQSQSHYCL